MGGGRADVPKDPAQEAPGRADPTSRRAQALACTSLLACALFLALVVGFVFRNAASVVLGVLGVFVGIAGGWWALTRRSAPRVLGIAGLALGAVMVAVAVLRAGSESAASVVRLVVALALLGVAVITARGAVGRRLAASTAAWTRADPPHHPVLLCNPWSGGGKVERFGIDDLATSLGVETVMLDHDLDLGELARTAVAEGADCLGMAGGDGSQALVASIAVQNDLPFVCVSAGTRNHFALDLGLDREDPRHSVHAFRDAVERRVDYATVNDRFFVNNVSLGVYATIVQQAEYRGAKAQTTQQMLPEMLGGQEPFDLQFATPDGREIDGAFLIMVSNNPYVLSASPEAAQRRSLEAARLGVFAVSARTGAQAAHAITLALAGRASLSPYAHVFESEEFVVDSRSGSAFAGVDGEALELPTPLRFHIHPGGLRMLVPEGNAEISLQRRAHDVRLPDLADIARGS
jgi:diacylglycerol kinase family enzyme